MHELGLPEDLPPSLRGDLNTELGKLQLQLDDDYMKIKQQISKLKIDHSAKLDRILELKEAQVRVGKLK